MASSRSEQIPAASSRSEHSALRAPSLQPDFSANTHRDAEENTRGSASSVRGDVGSGVTCVHMERMQACKGLKERRQGMGGLQKKIDPPVQSIRLLGVTIGEDRGDYERRFL